MRYKKVLLIDTDEVDVYISTRIMKTASLAEEILVKSHPKEALDYLESVAGSPDQLPDLIFLDLRMPETVGVDFLNEFMRLPDGIKNKCKILILTNSLNSDRKKIADAKNNPFVVEILHKPLTVEVLENI